MKGPRRTYHRVYTPRPRDASEDVTVVVTDRRDLRRRGGPGRDIRVRAPAALEAERGVVTLRM